METALRLDQLSGRYDRAPRLLANQLEASARHVDLIAVTEVDRPARGDVLELPGWTVVRGHDGARGESALLSRDATWRPRRRTILRLDTDMVGMRGAWYAPIALYEHTRTGATLVLTAGHTPSAVEAAWRRSARAVEYRSGVEQWRRVVLAWRREHDPDGEVATADWNLSLHLAWVRAHSAEAWPGLMPVPPSRTPAAGSHGRRLIDWPITRGVHDRTLRVLPPHRASDHRGVRLTGTIHTRPTRKEHP